MKFKSHQLREYDGTKVTTVHSRERLVFCPQCHPLHWPLGLKGKRHMNRSFSGYQVFGALCLDDHRGEEMIRREYTNQKEPCRKVSEAWELQGTSKLQHACQGSGSKQSWISQFLYGKSAWISIYMCNRLPTLRFLSSH